MPSGGRRAGAGRPIGVKNTPTREMQSKVRASGQTFLETMLYKRDYWMRVVATEMKKEPIAAIDPKTGKQVLTGGPDHALVQRALDKAEEAAVHGAPYVHQRLAAVAHTTVPYDLSKLTDEQLEQLRRIGRAAAVSADSGSGERGEATRH